MGVYVVNNRQSSTQPGLTLLWQNADPSSNIVNGTSIALTDSVYNYDLILFRITSIAGGSFTKNTTYLYINDQEHHLISCVMHNWSGSTPIRMFTFSEDGYSVIASNAKHYVTHKDGNKMENSNSSCIPVQIMGLNLGAQNIMRALQIE